MPSNKILTVLIICAAIVVSIYLFQRNPSAAAIAVKNVNLTGLSPTDTTQNNDWQKILTSINPADQGDTTVLTDNTTDSSSTVDTTLTGQMSRDVLSRYLLIANNGTGGDVSTDDANQIASDVIATPDYTAAGGAIYIESNLQVIPGGDKNTLTQYANSLNQIVKNRIGSINVKDDPATILQGALDADDETKLTELDPILAAGKGMLSDLLQMNVPKDMVTMHLALVNALSNLLSNTEDMRSMFVDPVKGLSGGSQYNKSTTAFQTALLSLNAYLNQKLK